MKKIFLILILLSACTSLSPNERFELLKLNEQGITVKNHDSSWEKSANPALAGCLNFMPGFGNLYLAGGEAAQEEHFTFAILNLFFWPVSIIWAVPEAYLDADIINKRDLIYHYSFRKES